MGKPLGNDTITILNAPLVFDPRDNTSYRDWDNPVATVVTKVMVEPFPMAEKLNFEDNRDREFIRTAFRFYCPPSTEGVVLPTSRVVWGPYELDVFGEPGPWRRFSGQTHHVAFIARERDG